MQKTQRNWNAVRDWFEQLTLDINLQRKNIS